MQPVVQTSDTTNTQISFESTEPDNGGSLVTGYIVYFKKLDDNDYIELVGGKSNFNQLNYIVSFGIEEGEQYQIIAKAVNRWGVAADFSEPTTILAATWPSKVTNVASSIDALTGGIQVTWSQALNRGTPISSYVLEVQGSLGWTLINECTGMGLSCLIPMSRVAGLGLTFMSQIPLRVAAINALGQGDWSAVE